MLAAVQLYHGRLSSLIVQGTLTAMVWMDVTKPGEVSVCNKYLS